MKGRRRDPLCRGLDLQQFYDNNLRISKKTWYRLAELLGGSKPSRRAKAYYATKDYIPSYDKIFVNRRSEVSPTHPDGKDLGSRRVIAAR
jgi:hypothetical protein